MRAWAAIAVVLAAGCDWPDPPAPAPPPTAPDDATLLAQRPYTVQYPVGYNDDAMKQWPLVIALHGYGGTGAEMGHYFGIAQLGRLGAYLYVAPNALKDRLGSSSWNPSSVHRPPWDVEYLSAVVRDVQAKERVDPRRITFIGFSQGAHMAHRMACDAADLVSGIVSIAGQVTKISSACVPAQHVSVLQVHGTLDEAIGYYGDVNVPTNPSIPSAHETVATWARNDGCTGPLTATGVTMDLDLDVPGEETHVDAYEGCPPGIAVELWTLQDSAHRPAPADDFAARIYGFLAAHPRP